MALAAYGFAVKRSPKDISILLLLVEEYTIMGKEEEALQVLNECFFIDRSNPYIINERGVLFYKLGQYKNAEDSFIQVIRLIESASLVRLMLLTSVRLKEMEFMNRLKSRDGFIRTLILRMCIGDEMTLIRPYI